MEHAYFKTRLLYSPKRGVFYWILPPPAHSDLMGEEAGTVCSDRFGKCYHVMQIDGVKYKRSRLAFFYITGRMPSNQIDHINGNSLDDRWQNLREATATQNMQNQRKRKRRVSLPTGVRVNKSGTFAARITVDKAQVQIGTFKTVDEASAAYQMAREKYFGQFA
jgi:hypothetical protein